MGAFGEDRADIGAGTDVPCPGVAALLCGVPAVPLPDPRVKAASDGGAAAASRSDARASEGGAAAGIAVSSGPSTQCLETKGPASVAETTPVLASPALATPDLKAALALLDAATAAAPGELAAANFSAAGTSPGVGWSPADDGAHNTAEFLSTRLRISTPEARRRLALANATLPPPVS